MPASTDAALRSRRGALLALLVPISGAALARPAQAPFDAAVASFRQGRYSEAFGRMLALATHGDADAARIVVFMHQYGPLLYGSYWDVAPDDVAALEELGASGKTRRQPQFRPNPLTGNAQRRR